MQNEFANMRIEKNMTSRPLIIAFSVLILLFSAISSILPFCRYIAKTY